MLFFISLLNIYIICECYICEAALITTRLWSPSSDFVLKLQSGEKQKKSNLIPPWSACFGFIPLCFSFPLHSFRSGWLARIQLAGVLINALIITTETETGD